MNARKLYKDERGYLSVIHRRKDSPIRFVEDRISYSTKGVIRGLHGDDITYKLATCIYGELLLVVYDFRTKKKEEIILSAENGKQFLIRPFTLNGHQCLSDEGCVLHYKWSCYYNLESQYAVSYQDPIINAGWYDIPRIISDRDQQAPSLADFLESRLINEASH